MKVYIWWSNSVQMISEFVVNSLYPIHHWVSSFILWDTIKVTKWISLPILTRKGHSKLDSQLVATRAWKLYPAT